MARTDNRIPESITRHGIIAAYRELEDEVAEKVHRLLGDKPGSEHSGESLAVLFLRLERYIADLKGRQG